jgi:hypothetical protein
MAKAIQIATFSGVQFQGKTMMEFNILMPSLIVLLDDGRIFEASKKGPGNLTTVWSEVIDMPWLAPSTEGGGE